MNLSRELRRGLLVVGLGSGLTVLQAQVQPVKPNTSYLFDNSTGPLVGSVSATINGSVSYTSSTTPFSYGGNTSLNFTGGYVTISGIDFGASGSLSFWTRAASGSPGTEYSLDTSGPRFLFYTPNTDPVYISGQNVYMTSANALGSTLVNWTNVVLTWTAGGERNFYLNGALIASVNGGTISSSNQTVFLGSNDAANERWSGQIDEFALWDSTLSADNVSWLASNSIESIPEPSATVWLAGGAGLASAMVWRPKGRAKAVTQGAA